MRTTIRLGALLIATSLFGVAPSVRAQDKPCMADAARLCPGVEPASKAQMTCLKSHMEEVSPACKKKLATMKMRHEEQQQEMNKEMNKQMEPAPTPPQQQQP
jgi:hypothetical protein